MRIIFVRHGQTTYNKKSILQGQRQVRLSKLGERQAKETARRLKRLRPDYIYSSDLRRAVQTTKEIVKFHSGVPISFDSRLRERYLGSWQGKSMKSVGWYENQSKLWSTDYRPGGGESLGEVRKRQASFLKDLLKTKHKLVIIIGHGDSGRLFKGVILGKNVKQSINIPLMKNAGFESIQIRKKR